MESDQVNIQFVTDHDLTCSHKFRRQFVIGVYGPHGERVRAQRFGVCGDDEANVSDMRVLAQAQTAAWPTYEVCIWADLMVNPPMRRADAWPDASAGGR